MPKASGKESQCKRSFRSTELRGRLGKDVGRSFPRRRKRYGRRKVPGRPLQWGTSEEFLEYFGLENLKDLPGIEELKATGLLEKRDSLTSIILPDDTPIEEDEDEQDELFSLSYGEPLEEC